MSTNIWCIKNRTKHSSKTLLSLVRFLMHQTLEELLSFMPIGSFLALLSVELYSTLNNTCSWWNGGKRELKIVSVTSLLTQKAICSLYFSGSLHNTSVHQDFGVSRQLVIILWVSWGCSTNQRYQITVRLLDKCVEPRRHSLNAPFNLVDTTGNYSSP